MNKNKKIKIKLIRSNKNLFNIVVALKKKSMHSCVLEKLGVIFIRKNKKIIMLSLKKLAFWLNRGASMSNYISYLSAFLFNYFIKKKNNNKNKRLILDIRSNNNNKMLIPNKIR